MSDDGHEVLAELVQDLVIKAGIVVLALALVVLLGVVLWRRLG